jgi:adenylate kinase
VDILLMGPPGVGKGTQAQSLAERAGLVHLASGDLLREHMRSGTPLGVAAKRYVDEGALVPDELVTGMVLDRMLAPDCEGGTLLDGFPRTLGQALELELQLADHGRRIDVAVLLTAPAEILIERIVGRRSCPGCGAGYHLASAPPLRAGVCDHCGAALVGRSDDNEETARRRLDVYTEQTAPVAGFYRSHGVLHEIDGTGSPAEVSARLAAVLGEPAPVAGD